MLTWTTIAQILWTSLATASYYVVVAVAFALVLTCVIWRTSNSYYTHMLAAKYKAIYAVEDQLGMHPIRDEWAALRHHTPLTLTA